MLSNSKWIWKKNIKCEKNQILFLLCYMRQIDACIGKRAHRTNGIKQKSRRSEIQTFEFAYLERAFSKKEKQEKYVYRENKVVSLHYNGSAHNLSEQASERTNRASKLVNAHRNDAKPHRFVNHSLK